ncbi:restriction endonuclease subunit S [uncultured Tolumonas sp.]|uniref:restriction endonuclease subunit S n=1 Tax=uncultured Tolumonas sp. TaxID=263765 RepID=UPI00292DE742|nr:restriction endonuclease subunit S [uncultured Tolumonas sp.]
MPESLITQHIDLWISAIEAKSTAGRGSNNKFDLYGIKKLRELILELAVRGKLVPQDPTDEPASVLLESIAAEKARLIKAKKIKKPIDLSEITDEEKLFELPQGWEWVRLGDLSSDIHYGYTASAKENFSGVRLLRITDIQNDKVNWTTVPDCDIEEDRIPNYLLENDDILIARTGGTIGKSYLVENINVRSVFASYLIRVKRIDFMFSPYIKTYLGSQLYWHQLFDNAAGTGQPNVNATALKSLFVTLPPLNEQPRIVAKVDELMALCDQLEQQTLTSIDAHATLVETLLETLTNSADAAELEQNWARISEHFDTLFTTEQSIDALKQTILQLAVMGKLVRQDPTDEPASVLLEKIAAEKAQLIKDKKIKKEKPLPPISDEEKPFELPQGWEWCRVWDIAHTITSGSRDWAKYYSDTGAKFITMGNLSRGDYKLRMDTIRYVNPPIDGEGLRTKLEANDLLISITGDVGNLGLIPIDFGDAYINQHTCMLRFITPCRNLFFPNMMRSPWAKYQFDAPQRGIKNSFRLGDVGEMLIPLPPLEEQYRIVDKIEKLLSLCESIKWKLNKSISIQLHLTDSIVDKALS